MSPIKIAEWSNTATIIIIIIVVVVVVVIIIIVTNVTLASGMLR